MSTLHPAPDGVGVFDLGALQDELARAPAIASGGRQARTLLKDGALRITLIVLGAGAAIPEHRADGPITVHALSGRIAFSVGGRTHDLEAGHVLSLRAGLPHSVRSDSGGAFLLTVCLSDPAR